MPSWQAQLMNACTRSLLKPLMRFGSVDSMRAMTGTWDEQQGAFVDLKLRAQSRRNFDRCEGHGCLCSQLPTGRTVCGRVRTIVTLTVSIAVIRDLFVCI